MKQRKGQVFYWKLNVQRVALKNPLIFLQEKLLAGFEEFEFFSDQELLVNDLEDQVCLKLFKKI